MVASGAPFVAELDEAKSLGADEKIFSVANAICGKWRAKSAALAQELRALIPAMLKASGAQAPLGGFLERLEANAGKLVRIRPVDAPAGDDASAVLARVEIEAAHAAIDDALDRSRQARCCDARAGTRLDRQSSSTAGRACRCASTCRRDDARARQAVRAG